MSPTATTTVLQQQQQSPRPAQGSVHTPSPTEWLPPLSVYPATLPLATMARQFAVPPSVNPAAYGSYSQTPSIVNSTMPASASRLGLSSHMSSEPSPRAEGPVKLSTTNLYIKGLTADATDQSLKALCMNYGTILSTKAVLDPQTLKCKGFGFVDFEIAEHAQAALESLRHLGYQVGMAKKQEQADTNVFFKNLPPNITKDDLERWVSVCGTVSSVHIMKQNGQSTGIGFARMASKADCEKIIEKYNNTKVEGSEERLLVKFADQPNRQKSQQVRALTGQELQGTLALAPGPTSYLFPSHPHQGSLSLGTPATYPESSLASMTLAAQGMAHMSATVPHMGAMMPVPNVPVHHAQFPSLPAATAAAVAAANYGYLNMAPPSAAYQSLQPQYAPELQLQPQPPTATAPGPYYVSTPGVQQVMPGMQATMDPTVGGMAQWQ